MSSIARKATFNLLAKGIVTIFSFVSLYYIGHNIDQTQVGIYAFALGFVGVLFFIADMGYTSAHVKRLSEGKDEASCNATFIIIKAVLTIAMVIVTVVAAYSWEFVFGDFEPGQPGLNGTYIQAIFIMLAYFVLMSIAQIPIQTFMGKQESAKQQVPEMIGTVARAPVIIYIAMAGLGVIALCLSYVLTGIIMLVLATYMFLGHPVGKPSREMLRSYTKYAVPISILSFIGLMVQNVDKPLILFFSKDPAEVARYFMVQRITLIYILISSSVGPILFPKLSETHARRGMAELQALCQKAERYTSMIIVPLVAMTVALTPVFIMLFVGRGYLDASNVLVILSIYALILSIDMSYITVIYCVDRPDLSMRLGIITMGSTIVLFGVLVPKTFFGVMLLGGGAIGAATATLIGASIEYAVSRYYAYKVAKIVSYRRIGFHMLAGICMACVLYMVGSYMDFEMRWYELGAVCSLGLLIYIGLLWAVDEFTKKDFLFFLDLLNVRKMINYIRGEIKGKK